MFSLKCPDTLIICLESSFKFNMWKNKFLVTTILSLLGSGTLINVFAWKWIFFEAWLIKYKKQIMCTLLLHVKLETVEIRSTFKNSPFYAHFFPSKLMTQKVFKMGISSSILLTICFTKKFQQMMNSRKKPFPSNSAHKWGCPQSSEWNRKQERHIPTLKVNQPHGKHWVLTLIDCC